MKTLYTASKIKKLNNLSEHLYDELYKTSHGSDDGNTTLCGIELDSMFYITDNTFTGTITCKKCLSVLKVKPHLQDRV